MTTYTPSNPPAAPPPGAADQLDETPPEGRLQRPFRKTLRRHRVLLLSVLCLLASAVYLFAPLLARSYDLSGNLTVKLPAFEPIPDLARLPEIVIKNINPDSSLHIQPSSTDPSTRTLQLSTSAP